MTEKRDDIFCGFLHLKEAWYAKSALTSRFPHQIDQVYFGNYGAAGGMISEMSVEWIDLSIPNSPTPRLGSFGDSWHLFKDHRYLRLLARLTDLPEITPEQFCALLIELGFKDITARKKPERLEKLAK